MVHIITGRAGTGKTALLLEKVRDIALTGESIYYIVPEQWSMAREQYINQNGLSDNVTVLSFRRLYHLLFRQYGGSACKYLDEAMRTALIYKALSSVKGSFKFYTTKRLSAGFVESVSSVFDLFAVNMMKKEEVLPALERHGQAAIYAKYQDLFLAYDAYHSLMEKGWSDASEDADKAISLLNSHPFFEGATVVFDGFHGFTGQQHAIISNIINKAKTCYFVFCADNDPLFETVNAEIQRVCKSADKCKKRVKRHHISHPPLRLKKDDLLYLEQNLFAPVHKTPKPHSENVSIYAAKNITEELEYIALDIKNSVCNSGLRYRDIAVVSVNSELLSSFVTAIFQKHNIPIFVDKTKTIIQTPLLTFVTCAIEIVTGGWELEQVIALIKTGLCGICHEDISLLERYTYMWRLRGSSWYKGKDWTQNPSGFGEWEQDGAVILAKINRLREQISAPLIAFGEDTRAVNGRELLMAVVRLFEHFDVEQNLVNNAKYYATVGDLRTHKEYLRIYSLFMDMLDGIALVYKDEPLSLDEFYDILTLSARNMRFGSTPSGLDQVIFGDTSRVRVSDIKRMYIPCVNEGIIPAAIKEPVINNREKAIFIKNGIGVPETSETLALKERFLFYTTLFSACEKIKLSYSIFTMKGEPMLPSVYIKMICSAIEPVKLDISRLDPHFYFISAPAAAALATRAVVSDEIGSIIEQKTGYSLSHSPFNDAQPLSEGIVKGMYGRHIRLSFSSADIFTNCPFKYFIHYGLRLKKIEPVRFSAAEIGGFMHYGLERLLRGNKDILNAERQEVDKMIDEIAREYLQSFADAGYAEKKRFIYLYKRMTQALSRAADSVIRELRSSIFKACDFEVDIKGMLPPLEISKEMTAQISGVIDRVDICHKQDRDYLRVVDYKSGKSGFSLEDIYNGLALQLPIYTAAVLKSGRYNNPHAAAMLYLKTPIIEYDWSKMKDKSEQGINNAADKQFLRDGLYLNEDWLENETSSFAAQFTKSSDRFVSEEKIEKLLSFTIEKFKGVAKGILDGETHISPLMGKTTNPCRYCDYGSICNFEGGCGKARNYQLLENKNFFDEI